MITSAGSDWPSDVAIQDWREAALNVPCKVRFKLFTLDDTLIVRKLGTLSKRDGEVVKKAPGHVLATKQPEPDVVGNYTIVHGRQGKSPDRRPWRPGSSSCRVLKQRPGVWVKSDSSSATVRHRRPGNQLTAISLFTASESTLFRIGHHSAEDVEDHVEGEGGPSRVSQTQQFRLPVRWRRWWRRSRTS